MQITSDFDGGNIAVLEAKTADNIRLEIRLDNKSDFYQWFYFRLSGAKGQPVVMHMENAGGSAYAEGWQDYRAVASSDGETWERVDTNYDGATLTIRHTPGAEAVQLLKDWTSPYGGQWAGVVATPSSGLGKAVVLTAWRKILKLDEFDPAAAAAFVDRFRGRGPEKKVR